MLLVVVPGAAFPELAERVVAVGAANAAMRDFYAARAVASGPSS